MVTKSAEDGNTSSKGTKLHFGVTPIIISTAQATINGNHKEFNPGSDFLIPLIHHQ